MFESRKTPLGREALAEVLMGGFGARLADLKEGDEQVVMIPSQKWGTSWSKEACISPLASNKDLPSFKQFSSGNLVQTQQGLDWERHISLP